MSWVGLEFGILEEFEAVAEPVVSARVETLEAYLAARDREHPRDRTRERSSDRKRKAEKRQALRETKETVRVCPVCDVVFSVTHEAGRPRTYCSDFCRCRAKKDKRVKRRRPDRLEHQPLEKTGS